MINTHTHTHTHTQQNGINDDDGAKRWGILNGCGPKKKKKMAMRFGWNILRPPPLNE